MVYKFYCVPSVLGWFGSDGAMVMDINDKIMVFDYQNYHTEILTVDAQGSYKGGVLVLVIGCMTGSNFKGYFILNDILRYIDNDADNGSSPKLPSSPTFEVDNGNGNVVPQLEVVVFEENSLAVDKGLAEENGHAKENSLVENSVASRLLRDILVEPPKAPSVPTVHEAPTPTSNRVLEKNEHRAKAYAIFVGNWPMNTTCEDLEKLFKKFGSIKNDDGIQVRSSRGTCFGFVEFESATSMQSTLRPWELQWGKCGYGRNEFEKRGKKVARYVINSM
ncbi:hypothetical protein UlMin_016305 [Ulmus minor]